MKCIRRMAAACGLFLCLVLTAVPAFADEPETTTEISTEITEAATEAAEIEDTDAEKETTAAEVTTEADEKTTDVQANESAFSMKGNLTIVDDVVSAVDGNKEFITVRSKSGYTFYMVIDRDSAEDGNVYFLNLVDDSDLYAITGITAEEAPVNAEVETVAVAENTTSVKTDSETVSGSGLSTKNLITIGAVVAVIGGVIAVYFVKKKKSSHQASEEYAEGYDDENEE